jgi:hypothetical protein
VRLVNLMKFGTAAHYSYIVESPFQQRGGLLLVAGPGNMKSTIVKYNLAPFPNQLTYSDLTLKQLAVIRSQIANGIYQTLGFLELEKVYARQQSVALNFEGVIKAMVEEGFSHFAFEDQRCWVPTARCFVYASVLDNLYRFHFPRWQDNGFLRRFITFKYTLSREAKAKLKDAIHEGDLVEMPSTFIIPTMTIPMNVTKEESLQLEQILGSDDGLFTPLNLLRKCLTVLKWYYKKGHKRKDATPMEIIQDLRPGISPMGGTLEI